MGTNSGWPNFSTPNVLITACVAGASMKSAKALPPAALTRGPLAGLTSITEETLNSAVSPSTSGLRATRLLNARYVARSVSVYARRSSAIPSVAPMPCPDSMYQGAAGVTPACFHSACSRMCVPDLSPRETKRAPAAAIFANAATARFSPPILAGSASGPTTMKSLYMTSRRSWSLPSSTYFFSREGAWTRTTSASPRAARASAWPVPTDAVFTVRPVCRSKIGTRTSSRPESCVLVVVDRMTVRDAGVCAAPAATPSTMTKRAAAIRATCALCLKKHNWGQAAGVRSAPRRSEPWPGSCTWAAPGSTRSSSTACRSTSGGSARVPHPARHRLLSGLPPGLHQGGGVGPARPRRAADPARAEPARAARRRRLRHAPSLGHAAPLAARLRAAPARHARGQGPPGAGEGARAPGGGRGGRPHQANSPGAPREPDRGRHARPHRRRAVLPGLRRRAGGGDRSLPRADGARPVVLRRQHQLDHTLLQPPLEHVGVAREQREHAAVVGDEPGPEACDSVFRRGAKELRDEQRAQPLAPPAVLHDAGALGDAPLHRLAARDADQRGRRRREVLDHEREAAVVVHVGEEACPVGRQATHDGEEALVARVAAGAIVELGEARFVVGTDRPEAQTLAARQRQRPVEAREAESVHASFDAPPRPSVAATRDRHTTAPIPPSKLIAVPVMKAARAEA